MNEAIEKSIKELQINKTIPCKVFLEGIDTKFDALDVGFPKWNGWFDGYVEMTTAIMEIYSECEEDVSKLEVIKADGKGWIRTNGYCFMKAETEDQEA